MGREKRRIGFLKPEVVIQCLLAAPREGWALDREIRAHFGLDGFWRARRFTTVGVRSLFARLVFHLACAPLASRHLRGFAGVLNVTIAWG